MPTIWHDTGRRPVMLCSWE